MVEPVHTTSFDTRSCVLNESRTSVFLHHYHYTVDAATLYDIRSLNIPLFGTVFDMDILNIGASDGKLTGLYFMLQFLIRPFPPGIIAFPTLPYSGFAVIKSFIRAKPIALVLAFEMVDYIVYACV